ncbi:phosphoribosylanthranilate isomerase [Brytella acorum]|uniref:N-(5'-phosphoribosyl)anthranilate isomerase n=1 Tax=Brytella acorum TaxID=2959299 RepID=A0AA35UFV4_9PROT|nr:phosphoribosylanthranilate isomerase [Brytella acorum]MDF3623351.1 phosphoribosylanthranilate isomerase [Brytella acorum]CAI9120430.1 phosphoribosylanthranilate isomerase [Brytella acorum]
MPENWPCLADRPGVKICGLNDDASVQTSIEAGADWLGFVFFERSPRHLALDEARRLTRRAEALKGRRVGLFVKPLDDEIARVLDVAELDILQIYDIPERAETLRARFARPVWLSCGISARDDLPQITRLDGLIIEARPDDHAARPGGNGQSFDWSLTAGWSSPAPWLLAGGLSPENVATALAASGARAVDVSSGVESAPGKKSPELIRKFIKAARGYCLPLRN